MSAVIELAALERHAVKLPDGLVERALHEVLALGGSDAGFASGRVDDARDLPSAAAEVDVRLRSELIDPLGEREAMHFELGFLKAGDGDAPPEQTFAPTAMAGAPRVFRVLVNLSEYPRRVLLWRGGADEPAQEVLIPGRRSGALHALHYVAGEVPHCAINDALGYFMVSYEAPV
jgi:hypothetical protein